MKIHSDHQTSLAAVALFLLFVLPDSTAQNTLGTGDGVAQGLEPATPYFGVARTGYRPGQEGLFAVNRNDGVEFIFSSFHDCLAEFWQARRLDESNGTYSNTFISSNLNVGTCSGIAGMATGEVLPAPGAEIVAVDEDGGVRIWSSQDYRELGQFQVDGFSPKGLALVNATDDAPAQIVMSGNGVVASFSTTGTPLWSVPVSFVGKLVVAQMDDDPALEVATAGGVIIDTADQVVQWDALADLGVGGGLVTAGDLDGDGRFEAVIAQSFGTIWALDVELQQPLWEFDNFNTSALHIADVDEDGSQELLVGDAQFGGVTIYDGLTLAQEGFIQNPDHGIPAIMVADVDGDDALEIVWTSGSSSSAIPHLFVHDAASGVLEWRSPGLLGPFVGPVHGDVTGDGVPDIVFAPRDASHGKFGVPDGPRLQVHSTRSFSRTGFSKPVLTDISWTGGQIWDIQLHDVDDDGVQEILVGAERLFKAYLLIHGVNANGKPVEEWRNATQPSGVAFESVAAGDVDGDGDLEILGGTGGQTTGSIGNFVYVYDYATGVEEWRTPTSVGSIFDSITELIVGDLDHDLTVEIFALLDGGDVTIWDGSLQVVEQVIPGTFTSMSRVRDRLLLSDENGTVSTWRHDGNAWVLHSATPFVPGIDLDGAALAGHDRRLFIGADEVLSIFDHATSLPTWVSAPHGRWFGQRMVTIDHPSGEIVLASGDIGLVGFRTGQ